LTNGIAPAHDRPVAPNRGNRLSVLDAREAEVLRLLSLGLTNRQIADRICYSMGTVKNVVQCIIEKLGVADRAQAAKLVLGGLKTSSPDNTRQ
jgi:DNA-binding NarL/FixJ family response regulator